MALQIDSNKSAVAHHIFDGPTTFPYAIDAHSAVSRHPLEWRAGPWTKEDADAARRELVARREREIADAKRRGLVPPPPLVFDEPEALTDEDRAALDEHDRLVAEAAERLADYRARKAEESKVLAQVAADEALVNSAPPVAIKRPFGRTGEPTPAELELMRKREAKKADDERIAQEKAEADRLAGNTNSNQ